MFYNYVKSGVQVFELGHVSANCFDCFAELSNLSLQRRLPNLASQMSFRSSPPNSQMSVSSNHSNHSTSPSMNGSVDMSYPVGMFSFEFSW